MSGSSPRGRGTLSLDQGGVCASDTYGSSPRGRGTQGYPCWANSPTGSSPRGRGTLEPPPIVLLRIRFIPAWAGNTADLVASRCCTYRALGSSPRGRGTPTRHRARQESAGRFIPAWAGNTSRAPSCTSRFPVHPRVGGEHFFSWAALSAASGSSPRGRGTRALALLTVLLLRFIPAWAGNTREAAGGCSLQSVHPRVGGEHNHSDSASLTVIGSSPRGRGTQADETAELLDERFIPAWAGNTSVVRLRPPRSVDGSSPRGRGTPRSWTPLRHSDRFIPAWAGNTPRWSPGFRTGTVHPRVGGEHIDHGATDKVVVGSSPRGRGTR